MFQTLGAYIKNIALLMTVAVFAEMTAPSENIKKYVSVVVGLIMIFTIVGKFKMFSADMLSEEAVSASSVITEKNIEYSNDNITERLTGIIYDEMNEVDNNSYKNDGLGIEVEKAAPYDKYTNGEVVE